MNFSTRTFGLRIIEIMKRNRSNFKHFTDAIPSGKISLVRQDILDKCQVSRMTYSKWRRGVATPTKVHGKVINKIATKYKLPIVYNYAPTI